MKVSRQAQRTVSDMALLVMFHGTKRLVNQVVNAVNSVKPASGMIAFLLNRGTNGSHL